MVARDSLCPFPASQPSPEHSSPGCSGQTQPGAVGPALLCCSRDNTCQFQQVIVSSSSFPAVRLCNSYWSREVQGRECGGPEDVVGWLEASFLALPCGGPYKGLKGKLGAEHDSQPRGVSSSPSRHPQMLPSAAAGLDVKVELTGRKRAWKKSLVPLRPESAPLWAPVQGCEGASCPRSCEESPALPISPQMQQVEDVDVDNILLGMSSQIAEREDNIVVEDLQGLHSLALQLARQGGTPYPGAEVGLRWGGRSHHHHHPNTCSV